MYCSVRTFEFRGLEVSDFEIEVSVSSRGIPRVEIIGIKPTYSREAVKKIRTAFSNSGLSFPNKKINVNIPSNIHISDASGIEFPIAMGILCVQHDLSLRSSDVFYGSLSTSGTLVPSTRTALLKNSWWESGERRLIIPSGSLYFGGGGQHPKIYEINSLKEAVDFYKNDKPKPVSTCRLLSHFKTNDDAAGQCSLQEISGNELAKRAVTISVAGRHNILMLGPSGVGKSIIAKGYPGLFSFPTEDELIERIRVAALLGLDIQKCSVLPFRSPHISTSEAKMIGSYGEPGEATLAHKGILFLDEIHLFKAGVLNALKTVVDNREIEFQQNGLPVKYPADFLLVGAGNSCMCGLLGSKDRQCKCSGHDINTYNARLNPAFLERFDLQVYVTASSEEYVSENLKHKNSPTVVKGNFLEKIKTARLAQEERLRPLGISYNSQMPYTHVSELCKLEKDAVYLLDLAASKYGLSIRAVHKIMSVSRTIADMEGAVDVRVAHIAEAIQYRVKNDKP